MNRRTFFVAIMMGALLPLMAISVAAQDHEAVADIPFNFTICNDQMPAGKYKVRLATTSVTKVLVMRSEDGQFAEIACTHSVQSSRPSSGGRLIFNRYGNQYFLTELWFPGEMTGTQLFKSDREEALIKEVRAQKKREKVTITVKETKPN